jgi:hypothetical protein
VVGAPPHWQPILLRSIGCQCGELLLGSGLLQTNLYTTAVMLKMKKSWDIPDRSLGAAGVSHILVT